MMLRIIAAAWLIMLGLAVSSAVAADGETHGAPAHADVAVDAGGHTAHAVHSQPVLPVQDAIWAGAAVIAIAALFLAAASIGTIVRPNMADEPPQAPPADDHAADHHH
jgi:hypothetical protein